MINQHASNILKANSELANIQWTPEQEQCILSSMLEFGNRYNSPYIEICGLPKTEENQKPEPKEKPDLQSLSADELEDLLVMMTPTYIFSFKLTDETLKAGCKPIVPLYNMVKAEYKTRVSEFQFKEHINLCIETYNEQVSNGSQPGLDANVPNPIELLMQVVDNMKGKTVSPIL